MTTAAATFTDSTEPVTKKAKLVNPDRSYLIPTPPLLSSQAGQTGYPNEQQTGLTTSSKSSTNSHAHAPPSVNNSEKKVNGSVQKKEKETVEPAVSQPLILEKGFNSSKRKKKEKDKKKKQKHKDTQSAANTVVTSDPTSTTNIPDHSRYV